MNIKRLILATCITLATAIMFTACEGPAGAPGPQGITGLTGAAGPQPKDTSYTILDTLWVMSTNTAGLYTCQVVDSQINTATYNGGVVLVYAQVTQGTGDFYALPASNILATNDYLNYSYNNSSITLYYSYTSGTTVVPTVPVFIKAVVMQPSVIRQNPNVNYKDYHAVMALLQSLKQQRIQ